MYVVGDDTGDIRDIIQYIVKSEPDFLLVSGGLGPTFDDKTLQGVALALNRPLKLDEWALEIIRDKYKKIFEAGLTKTDKLLKSRLKMALLPQDATPLPNPLGTAPAVKIRYNKTSIFCLPGVPAELKAIFEQSIDPLIKSEIKGIEFYERALTVEGVVESELAEHIKKLMKIYRYVYIKSHPQSYEGSGKLNIHLSTSGGAERLEVLNKACGKIEDTIKKMGGKII